MELIYAFSVGGFLKTHRGEKRKYSLDSNVENISTTSISLHQNKIELKIKTISMSFYIEIYGVLILKFFSRNSLSLFLKTITAFLARYGMFDFSSRPH